MNNMNFTLYTLEYWFRSSNAGVNKFAHLSSTKIIPERNFLTFYRVFQKYSFKI